MQPTAKGLPLLPCAEDLRVACALVEALTHVLPHLRRHDPALARSLAAAAARIPHALSAARLACGGARAVRLQHRAYLHATEARKLLLVAEARRYFPPGQRVAATVLAGQLVQLVAPTV